MKIARGRERLLYGSSNGGVGYRSRGAQECKVPVLHATVIGELLLKIHGYNQEMTYLKNKTKYSHTH